MFDPSQKGTSDMTIKNNVQKKIAKHEKRGRVGQKEIQSYGLFQFSEDLSSIHMFAGLMDANQTSSILISSSM